MDEIYTDKYGHEVIEFIEELFGDYFEKKESLDSMIAHEYGDGTISELEKSYNIVHKHEYEIKKKNAKDKIFTYMNHMKRLKQLEDK